MSFFSNEVASTLQYVTFPLEFVGLVLATIEVRFPSLAVRIATSMDDLTIRLRSVDDAGQRDRNAAKQLWDEGQRIAAARRYFADDYSGTSMTEFFEPIMPVFRVLGPVFRMTFRVAFFGLICLLLMDFVLDNPALDVVWSILGVVLTFLGYLLLMAVLVFFAWLILLMASFFSTSFVEGRAVGTLGIIIAGCGLLGEAYQFTTQMVV